MAVMTVKGPIGRKELGITAPHEHALIDISNQYTGSREAGSHGWSGKVRADCLEELMANPYAMRDNLILDDERLSLKEIQRAAAAGLRTFVDVTLPSIGRNPLYLRKLSEQTGLHVVAGCGYYTADTHPPRVEALSEAILASEMICDLMKGMDGTDICAGVIGEIGTSGVIHENERKVLRAAALAHRATGAPVMVHLYPWGKSGLEVLGILEEAGVEASRICMCHTDVSLDMAYMEELLRRGVYLEFDNFGKEFHMHVPYGSFPTDKERLTVFYRLADAGYANRLLASCDICLKVLCKEFGGMGYAHILEGISQMIVEQQKDAEQLLRMTLLDNPAEYLDNPSLDVVQTIYK